MSIDCGVDIGVGYFYKESDALAPFVVALGPKRRRYVVNGQVFDSEDLEDDDDGGELEEIVLRALASLAGCRSHRCGNFTGFTNLGEVMVVFKPRLKPFSIAVGEVGPITLGYECDALQITTTEFRDELLRIGQELQRLGLKPVTPKVGFVWELA